MKLRLGIVTPVVHINPRFDPPSWESTGTIEDIIAVAKAAESFGFGRALSGSEMRVAPSSQSRPDPFAKGGRLAPVSGTSRNVRGFPGTIRPGAAPFLQGQGAGARAPDPLRRC